MDNVSNIPFPYGNLITFANVMVSAVTQFFIPAKKPATCYLREYSSAEWSDWVTL